MIIGLTGKNASGKGEVLQFLAARGFTALSLSDVLRAELKTRKKPVTRDNLTALGNDLRDQHGPSFLAEKILEKLEEGQRYVIDSFRNPEEVKAFRRAGGFLLLNIEAPAGVRFERMKAREREEDAKTLRNFTEMEERERQNADPTKQNLDACAALADHTIHNAGNLDVLHRQIVDVLKTRVMHRPRPSWDAYFMGIARVVAGRSNCMKRHVAAVIVKDGRIISTGYNGTPRGVKNCDEGGCPRCNALNPSGENLSECLCSHAEENAIVQAAYHGISIKDSTLYTTFSPCLICTKMIINAGIGEVVYNQAYPLGTEALRLLKEARVRIRQISPAKVAPPA